MTQLKFLEFLPFFPPGPKGQPNIQLTCNSGPKGLAWFVPSEATSTNHDNRNCQVELVVGCFFLLQFFLAPLFPPKHRTCVGGLHSSSLNKSFSVWVRLWILSNPASPDKMEISYFWAIFISSSERYSWTKISLPGFHHQEILFHQGFGFQKENREKPFQ